MMQTAGRTRAAACLVLALALAGGPAALLVRARPARAATSAATSAEAEAVIGRMIRSYAGLRDYVANVVVRVDMPQVEMPDMVVTAYYKAPDRTAIRARGFAMVPQQGLFLLPTIFGPERFTPVSLRTEGTGSAKLYHIVLQPKPGVMARLARSAHVPASGDSFTVSPTIPDVPVDVWVDPARWTIARIHVAMPRAMGGRPFDFDAATTYGRQGGYLLPQRTVVSMALPEGFPSYTMPRRPGASPTASDRAAEPPAGPVKGKVILSFTHYTVNGGVADAVFTPRR